MDHTTYREFAAGAALDDIDPDERRELDRHLQACLPCRRLSGDLEGIVGELALAATPMRPPDELRGQVLGALRSLPATVEIRPRAVTAPVAETAVIRRDRASWLSRSLPLAAAAVFAIAAAGLGFQNQQLNVDVRTANAALSDARAQLEIDRAAVAVATDPRHVTVALHAEPVAPGAAAVVMFRPGTDDAYLMATNLPATPEGQVYQLWFADSSGVHPLGTFPFDGEGAFIVPFGVDLATSAAAMVTLEPEGGATGDPGPQVVSGEF